MVSPRRILIAVAAVGTLSCQDAPQLVGPAADTVTSASRAARHVTVTGTSIYYAGLDNPRGLTFGPDGYLYVAEGGTGGTAEQTTAAQCDQVIPPIGPYSGDYTARISKISSAHVRTTVVDNLPSNQTSAVSGSLVSGVADVEFVGNTLYALLAAGGCSHGFPSDPNGVYRVN